MRNNEVRLYKFIGIVIITLICLQMIVEHNKTHTVREALMYIEGFNSCNAFIQRPQRPFLSPNTQTLLYEN